MSSNPAVGKKNFSFCKSRFRSFQLDANEINHDIHLANTLFQIKVRYKKYSCRLQWCITVHVSFNKDPHFILLTFFTVPYIPNIYFSTANGDTLVKGCDSSIGFSTMNLGQVNQSAICSSSTSLFLWSSSLESFDRTLFLDETTFVGKDLSIHNGCVFIHHPCFPPTTECQHGRCQ